MPISHIPFLVSPIASSAADWIGAAGSVVGALGTVAAVALALHLARRDGKRLAEEREAAALDRAEASEDRQRFREHHDLEMTAARRQGANRVSLTLEDYVPEQKLMGRRKRFVVRNAGPEPISMVHVVSALTFREDDMFAIAAWDVLEGGGSRRVEHEVDEGQRPCEVVFLDSNGVPWARSEFGVLTERASRFTVD